MKVNIPFPGTGGLTYGEEQSEISQEKFFQENLSAYSDKGWDLANGLWAGGGGAQMYVLVPL